MNTLLIIILLIIGICFLILGASLFVDGASGLAKKLHISDFVIGMTIVAFGTSAPELAVSFSSLAAGSSDVLLGNVVGSNIFNILLILGVSGLICKIKVQRNTLRLEIPFLIICSVIFWLFTSIGARTVEHYEGAVLFILFLAYMGYMTFIMLSERKARLQATSGNLEGSAPFDKSHVSSIEMSVETSQTKPNKSKVQSNKYSNKSEFSFKKIMELYKNAQSNLAFLIVITVVGLGLIILGSEFVVSNVNVLASMIENDAAQKILSVLVVALGTSLPELVTSVTAALKGNADIVIGNVIGSNLFNLLFVAGLPIMIFSATFTASYSVDIIVSGAAAALLAIAVLLGKGKLTRTGSALLLTALAGYMVYLFM